MNILAIGAHPDDIEFGCGGTLIKCKKAGHKIYTLVLSKGSMGGSAFIRQREQKAAARFLNVAKIYWGNFSDTNIILNQKLIRVIEDVVKETKPDIVFFNYFSDTHQDHRALAEGAISATRYVKKVLFYETPTAQCFDPDVFMDITDCLTEKLKLLMLHSSQTHKTRVPKLTILESATSCANFRGFQARVKYAEGFKSLRMMLEI
ncbi:MAG: PIG-L family deacetylase [Candidatus Omnitrophica bacterium]|nr:PIG-L family deacetylase [Candidatus Omnitrophota bacterium]